MLKYNLKTALFLETVCMFSEFECFFFFWRTLVFSVKHFLFHTTIETTKYNYCLPLLTPKVAPSWDPRLQLCFFLLLFTISTSSQVSDLFCLSLFRAGLILGEKFLNLISTHYVNELLREEFFFLLFNLYSLNEVTKYALTYLSYWCCFCWFWSVSFHAHMVVALLLWPAELWGRPDGGKEGLNVEM